MSDKWVIKPVGEKKLEITVPDDVTVEKVAEIDLLQLQRAIADWMDKQARDVHDKGFCLQGCGIQA